MRIAHVRERHGPAGTPWRLAAALGRLESPSRWLDLEVAPRRLIARDPRLAHNAILFRQPIATLDEHLARGLRIEILAELVEPFDDGRTGVGAGNAAADDDDAMLDAADLAFGPPILHPPAFRDFYAFEGHVGTMW